MIMVVVGVPLDIYIYFFFFSIYPPPSSPSSEFWDDQNMGFLDRGSEKRGVREGKKRKQIMSTVPYKHDPERKKLPYFDHLDLSNIYSGTTLYPWKLPANPELFRPWTGWRPSPPNTTVSAPVHRERERRQKKK